MFKWICLLNLCCWSIVHSDAQVWKQHLNIPIIQLQTPLDGKLKISGTFGELRLDHFHAGLDIKTDNQTGWPVKAAESGFISRIKISASGYGNALYITHPHLGITTVYAHLASFKTPVQKWVTEQQYKKESFELDTILHSSYFPISKGDIIAYSGNSGSSEGPHLHFEVRNTKSEVALNPLFFGIKVEDSIAPHVFGMKYYAAGAGFYNTPSFSAKVSKKDQQYFFEDCILPEGKYILAAGAYDQLNLTPENKNGIRKITLLQSDQEIFSQCIDTIDFNQTRFVNAMMDYGEKRWFGKDYYICSKLSENRVPYVYKPNTQNGIIFIKMGDTLNMTFLLEDFSGNISRLQGKCIGTSPENKKTSVETNSTSPDAGFELHCSTKSFYETSLGYFSKIKTKDAHWLSPVYEYKTARPVPVQESVVIKIPYSLLIQQQDTAWALIGLTDIKGRTKTLPTQKDPIQKTFWASTRELGKFGLIKDDRAPEIKVLNFHPASMKFKGNTIQINIADALSGIKSYRGEINGQWVLFRYDAKNSLLTYEMDAKCPSGKHNLKISVTDNNNNVSTKTITFEKP